MFNAVPTEVRWFTGQDSVVLSYLMVQQREDRQNEMEDACKVASTGIELLVSVYLNVERKCVTCISHFCHIFKMQ